MKGIILHGGHGTRLRPLTHTGPKQLLPIANKPMSQYALESLHGAGIKDIAIIVGGLGAHKVKEYYGTGEKFGVRLRYIEQDEPRGIAHAIGLCRDFVGNEKFAVFLGDNIIQRDISEFVENFLRSDAEASILLSEVNNPSQFGIAEVKDGKIKKITEKPKTPATNLAVTGIYFLSPAIFDIISGLKPSWRNELEIADALQTLIDKNQKITYYVITDYWKDTGTPEDIIHANKTILNKMESYFYGKKEGDVSIKGKTMIGQDAILKENSQIAGPVIIGKNCVIGPNVRLGPNTSIGDNSKLFKCDIEDSIIMPDCVIDCNIKIRRSIIATGSQIIKEEENQNEQVFLLGEGTKIWL